MFSHANLSLAISTEEGHSALQALQEMHKSMAAFTSGPSKASEPERAARNILARPRVLCNSSRVARKDGHMVPICNFRQTPAPLQSSVAASKPPSSEKSKGMWAFFLMEVVLKLSVKGGELVFLLGLNRFCGSNACFTS